MIINNNYIRIYVIFILQYLTAATLRYLSIISPVMSSHREEHFQVLLQNGIIINVRLNICISGRRCIGISLHGMESRQ